eukprot:273263_1
MANKEPLMADVEANEPIDTGEANGGDIYTQQSEQTTHMRAQKMQNNMALCRRYTCTIIHLAVVILYSFYLWHLSSNNKYRKLVLMACGWVYFFRVVITNQVMLERQITTEDVVFGPLIMYPLIHFSFGFEKSIAKNQNFHFVDIIFIVLYVVGSFFNTWSEFQRKRFKTLASSKGKLYTKGLFAWTRHPNYFGDALLFMGWGLLTWKWWNVWVSIVMTLTFLYYHIPDLEKYLKGRYSEWDQYEIDVAPFVPFIHHPKYKLD